MIRVWPKELEALWAATAHKRLFLNEPEITHKDDCQNCSGWGFMTCFVAYGGPYKQVPNEKKLALHWHDGWWIGETFSAECPKCRPGAIQEVIENAIPHQTTV
jgi:hypothetical protein